MSQGGVSEFDSLVGNFRSGIRLSGGTDAIDVNPGNTVDPYPGAAVSR